MAVPKTKLSLSWRTTAFWDCEGHAMLIGYARVSTSDQDLALQVSALERAGCEWVLTDTISGSKFERPGP